MVTNNTKQPQATSESRALFNALDAVSEMECPEISRNKMKELEAVYKAKFPKHIAPSK